jgi:hypothetical protein
MGLEFGSAMPGARGEDGEPGNRARGPPVPERIDDPSGHQGDARRTAEAGLGMCYVQT